MFLQWYVYCSPHLSRITRGNKCWARFHPMISAWKQRFLTSSSRPTKPAPNLHVDPDCKDKLAWSLPHSLWTGAIPIELSIPLLCSLGWLIHPFFLVSRARTSILDLVRPLLDLVRPCPCTWLLLTPLARFFLSVRGISLTVTVFAGLPQPPIPCPLLSLLS